MEAGAIISTIVVWALLIGGLILFYKNGQRRRLGRLIKVIVLTTNRTVLLKRRAVRFWQQDGNPV